MRITKENLTREEFASLKTKFRLDVAATSDGWALEGAYVLCTVPVNLKLDLKHVCFDTLCETMSILSLPRSVFQWHPELKIGFG